MTYLLMILVALLAAGIYLFFALSVVPGASQERFGTLEELPADVGKWKQDDDSPEAEQARSEGLIREVRHFYHQPQGFMDSGRLVLQVRYRDAQTRKIRRIEPEAAVARRRRRA